MFIARLYRTSAHHLSTAIVPHPTAHRASLLSPIPWEEIPIRGLAQIDTNDDTTDGARLFTTTISAVLCPDAAFTLATHQAPQAYMLLTTTRRRFLLGLPFEPHPHEQLTTTRENKPSGPSSQTLTITLKGPYPALEIF